MDTKRFSALRRWEDSATALAVVSPSTDQSLVAVSSRCWGGVAERPKAAVLKTVRAPEQGPRRS